MTMPKTYVDMGAINATLKDVYDKALKEQMERNDALFMRVFEQQSEGAKFRRLVRQIRADAGLPVPPEPGTYGAIDRNHDPLWRSGVVRAIS